jgi:hypothetical protein
MRVRRVRVLQEGRNLSGSPSWSAGAFVTRWYGVSLDEVADGSARDSGGATKPHDAVPEYAIADESLDGAFADT